MAVPTGEYELHARVDLGTPFGIVEHKETVSIVATPADALDRRLAEVESEDPEVRRKALIDLRYFKKHADKVVPVLLKLLDDESATVRMVAVSVFGSYPVQAKEHLDRFVAILTAEEEATLSEKTSAAYLVARIAPPDEGIRTILRNAAEEAPEGRKISFESALRNYERRCFPEKSEGGTLR